MKITKKKLRKLIKEALSDTISGDEFSNISQNIPHRAFGTDDPETVTVRNDEEAIAFALDTFNKSDLTKIIGVTIDEFEDIIRKYQGDLVDLVNESLRSPYIIPDFRSWPLPVTFVMIMLNKAGNDTTLMLKAIEADNLAKEKVHINKSLAILIRSPLLKNVSEENSKKAVRLLRRQKLKDYKSGSSQAEGADDALGRYGSAFAKTLANESGLSYDSWSEELANWWGGFKIEVRNLVYET
tara:strand:+ start:1932 stop:2651 length:720 start_codon:yes stop_codon:yes gene_type:complete